jgi:hypothetical protein
MILGNMRLPTPKVKFHTILLALFALIAGLLCILAECNDGFKAFEVCKWIAGYFSILTFLSPWVEAE